MSREKDIVSEADAIIEEMTQEEALKVTREKFADLATETDEEVKRISSAIHMGLTVMSMIDATEEAKQLLPAGVVIDENNTIGAETIVMGKQGGGLYRVAVSLVTEDAVDEHLRAINEAVPLDDALATKH